MKTEIIDKIFEMFANRGAEVYHGEEVTQKEHALQAALAAEKEGASPAMIVAALLHDVGHLLHGLPENFTEQGMDDHHENLGYRFLQKHFQPEVAELVHLHVPAKRYLCATDPTYYEQLSPTSKESLRLQGGVFSPSEVEAYEQIPFAREAAILRRYDDLAKIPNLPTPDLEHYRPLMEKVVLRSPTAI